MKTFYQYIEGLFDFAPHVNPIKAMDDEFINKSIMQFKNVPVTILQDYVQAKLKNDKDKIEKLTIPLMLACKSLSLYRQINSYIDIELKKRREESHDALNSK